MTSDYVNFLEKTMDVSVLKRNVNADNISNVNTPNFKATTVNFDRLFDEKGYLQTKTTNDKHIEMTFANNSDVKLEKDTTTKAGADGNNVDLNQEMVSMVKNNYVFGMGVQAINKEFTLEKTALGK